MLDCISVANMRDSDAYTIANLVPSLELMHRAAMGVYGAGSWQGRTAIVTGSGNNGGDGYALACILSDAGFDCEIFSVSDRLRHDSAHYAALARAAGVPVTPFAPDCLKGFDTVVDCLLGTGFQGPVRENYRAAIEAINESAAYVISVDINSGMNGDTGEGSIVVRSDLTVTIGYVKRGLVTEAAGKHIRRLICAPIGIELIHKEEQLCKPNEYTGQPGSIPAPKWLDMSYHNR